MTHLARSHEEAERWDLEFWQQQTPQQRLSALVAIREDIKKVGPRGIQVKRLRERKRRRR